ncbi:ABC transporter ATP-binding protein [Corynebacterium sp. A21]|uniref:ABC transporter ATP-binding protein n=1 Tax=Corynebacterium sp. A21 TaxID=3457318 RepID=UPI003FD39146
MINATGIGFRYPNSDWTFRHLDVRIPLSGITSLLGANGAGKSTLLRLLAGIADPTEGTVERCGLVGFVPQATAGVFAYTVFDMVLMGRAQHLGMFSAPGKTDRDETFTALDRVGMAHLSQRPFAGLSGGQQQLVLIARALATGCDALILDEPVSALDLRNQAIVLELIRDLAADGLAVVLSTHSPDHALHLGGQGLILGHGGQLSAGPAAEILTDEALTELYGVEVFRHHVLDGDRHRATVITRFESIRTAGTTALAGQARGVDKQDAATRLIHMNHKKVGTTSV